MTRHSRSSQKQGRKRDEKSNHHPAHGTKSQLSNRLVLQRNPQGDLLTKKSSLWLLVRRWQLDYRHGAEYQTGRIYDPGSGWRRLDVSQSMYGWLAASAPRTRNSGVW